MKEKQYFLASVFGGIDAIQFLRIHALGLHTSGLIDVDREGLLGL